VEWSWTTFILEAINFLVLVWLLKRLFYAPVKRAIDERRAAVEKTLQDAASQRRDAEILKSKLEDQLQQWETEKQKQREQLRLELLEEKTKRLKEVETSVALEREKEEALLARHTAERRAQDEKTAVHQALTFTSRLFSEMASPELENKIVDITVRQVLSSPAGQFPLAELKTVNHNSGAQIHSAYPLSDANRSMLSENLNQWLPPGTPISFAVDPQLLAGLEISMSGFVLRANLRDELQSFAELHHYEEVSQ